MSLETKKGAATDIDGNFQLSVPEVSKIRVSDIGYKDFEGVVTPHMEIRLAEDSEVLDMLHLPLFMVTVLPMV